MMQQYGPAFAFALLLLPLIGQAQSASPAVLPIHELSFEDLANITVTTASKRAEPVFQTPAAISVLDEHFIARLGATNVMDLLRFAPGVQVAQISPAAWGVGVRGFNSQDSRKLLVMRDGRSIYDTLFSGVWWDVQDPLLDDIARIEIVRGPGGSLWGANAVNGVINIITKPARETQGVALATTWLDDGLRLSSARSGWAAGPETFARLSLQHRTTGDADLLSGATGRNRHRLLSGSLRLDHGTPGINGFTLHGNFHTGRTRQALQLPVLIAPYAQTFTDDVKVAGLSLHGRWDRSDVDWGRFTVQTYYDSFKRGPLSLDQRNHSFDLDFQHETPSLDRHQVVWGAGYRQVSDELGSPSGNVTFSPSEKTRQWFSTFIQDEVTLQPGRWRWIAGSKFEHNDYSGWEIQPSTRVLFTPRSDITWWASVSRAVRTPDRTSDFMLRLATFPPPTGNPEAGPTELVFRGDPTIQSEVLLACETGLRFEPTDRVRIDGSLFWHDYDRLLNFSPGATMPANDPVRSVRYVGAANDAAGRTWGGELSLVWQVQRGWRLTANYSQLHMRLRGPGLPFLDNSAGQNPETMLTFHSSHDINERWNLDLMGRHSGKLPSWGVKASTELDIQLTWRPTAQFAIILLGRNLLHDSHFEAPSGRSGTPSAVVSRTVGLQLKFQH